MEYGQYMMAGAPFTPYPGFNSFLEKDDEEQPSIFSFLKKKKKKPSDNDLEERTSKEKADNDVKKNEVKDEIEDDKPRVLLLESDSEDHPLSTSHLTKLKKDTEKAFKKKPTSKPKKPVLSSPTIIAPLPKEMIEDNASLSELDGSRGYSGRSDDESLEKWKKQHCLSNSGSGSGSEYESSEDSCLDKTENWNSDGEYIGPEPRNKMYPPPKKEREPFGEQRIYQNKKTGEIVFIVFPSIKEANLKRPEAFVERFVFDENGELIEDEEWYTHPFPENSGYTRINKPPKSVRQYISNVVSPKPRYQATDSTYGAAHHSYTYNYGYGMPYGGYQVTNDDCCNECCENSWCGKCCLILLYVGMIALFIFFLVKHLETNNTQSNNSRDADNFFGGVVICGLIVFCSTGAILYKTLTMCANPREREKFIQNTQTNCFIFVNSCSNTSHRFWDRRKGCLIDVGGTLFYFMLVALLIILIVSYQATLTIGYLAGSIVIGIMLLTWTTIWLFFLIRNCLDPDWRRYKKEAAIDFRDNCKEGCIDCGKCCCQGCLSCLECYFSKCC